MAQTTFLIRRGPRAVQRRSRAHLAKFDAHGEIVGAWCSATRFDISSNVPWGLKTCKHCIRLASAR